MIYLEGKQDPQRVHLQEWENVKRVWIPGLQPGSPWNPALVPQHCRIPMPWHSHATYLKDICESYFVCLLIMHISRLIDASQTIAAPQLWEKFQNLWNTITLSLNMIEGYFKIIAAAIKREITVESNVINSNFINSLFLLTHYKTMYPQSVKLPHEVTIFSLNLVNILLNVCALTRY